MVFLDSMSARTQILYSSDRLLSDYAIIVLVLLAAISKSIMCLSLILHSRTLIGKVNNLCFFTGM